jgi:hypothetical protein
VDEGLGQIRIDRRFNGPPDSANGGYACGSLARFVAAPAETSLRSPPPLDRTLDVVAGAGEGTVELRDGETLVAESRSIASLDDEPPVRPSVAEATDAETRHPYLDVDHPFSHCFVCGYKREDGMGVHFGPLAAHPEVNAAVLRPGGDLPTEGGLFAPEILWAVLDCPSYAPALYGTVSLLARLSVEIARDVSPDETLVTVGWSIGSDGRKHHTASALLDEDGGTVARGRALWIEMNRV